MSDEFVIWSIEHTAWWRPGRMGYSPTIDAAGVYSRREAEEIVASANLVAFHECMIPTTAVLAAPSYKCPRCGAVSYNPNDIRERYCGACHRFEEP